MASKWVGLFFLSLTGVLLALFRGKKLLFSRRELSYAIPALFLLLASIWKHFILIGSLPAIASWLGLSPLLFYLFSLRLSESMDLFLKRLNLVLLWGTCAGAAYYVWESTTLGYSWVQWPVVVMGNSKHLSQFLVLIFAFQLASLEFPQKTRIMTGAVILSLILTFLLIYKIEARASLVAVAVIFTTYILFKKFAFNPLTVLLSLMGTVLAALSLFFISLVLFPQIYNYQPGTDFIPLLPQSMDHRVQIITATLGVIKAYPWLGVGPGLLLKIFPIFQDPFRRHDFWTENNFTDSSHNFLLDFAAEMGIPFLCLFLLIIYQTVLRPVYANWKKIPPHQLLSFALTMLAWVIEGMALFPHHLPLSLGFGLMSLSLGFVLGKKYSDQPLLIEKRPWGLILPLLIAFFSGGIYLYADYKLAKHISDLDQLTRTCDQFSVHWRLCGHVADLSLKNGQPKQAIGRYLKLLESFPYHFPYLIGLAHAYASAGDGPRSCQTFKVYEGILRRKTEDFGQLRELVCRGQ